MKKMFFVLFSAAVVFTACRKGKTVTSSTQPSVTVAKKMTALVRTTSLGTVETENYQYDATGRLSVWTTSKFIYSFDYSKPGSFTCVKKAKDNGEILLSFDCTLNSKNLVTKLVSKNPDGSTSMIIDYTYNTDDFVIKEVYDYIISGGSVTEYTIQDGNVTASVTKTMSGTVTSTSIITYDLTSVNTFNYSNAGYFPGDMFGKKSKNLQTGLLVKDPTGKLIFQANRTWEIGIDGYIKKDRAEFPLTGRVNETIYTFE